jgi:hypothetical protein
MTIVRSLWPSFVEEGEKEIAQRSGRNVKLAEKVRLGRWLVDFGPSSVSIATTE